MRSHSTRLAILAAGALLLGSCTEAPEPVGPGEPSPQAAAAAQDRLPEWFDRATPAVLALPGTVSADLDERNNRLVFGVENRAAAPAVQNVAARLGIPASAYVIQVTPPIENMATLRSRWRPTLGGIQIHFTQWVCTMGFNADAGGERSFITNSHCTERQGGVQGTEYFQPSRSVDPEVIAVEVDDPTYFRGGICPTGRRCRWSDASRARYHESTPSSRGVIARTAGPNTGSLDVTGEFTVSRQDNATTSFPLGATVSKVGRTTGWTQGEVVATCVHTNVSATNITQLCQTFVRDPGGARVVGGGDSGSGVFAGGRGDNIELVGILWGGNGDGTLFVFSPLKQIQDELGPLTAIR